MRRTMVLALFATLALSACDTLGINDATRYVGDVFSTGPGQPVRPAVTERSGPAPATPPTFSGPPVVPPPGPVAPPPAVPAATSTPAQPALSQPLDAKRTQPSAPAPTAPASTGPAHEATVLNLVPAHSGTASPVPAEVPATAKAPSQPATPDKPATPLNPAPAKTPVAAPVEKPVADAGPNIPCRLSDEIRFISVDACRDLRGVVMK